MGPRKLIILLAVLSMMGSISFDAYLPALPAIESRFGISAAVGQQSMTIYLAAFATMTLFTARFPIHLDAGQSSSAPSCFIWRAPLVPGFR